MLSKGSSTILDPAACRVFQARAWNFPIISDLFIYSLYEVWRWKYFEPFFMDKGGCEKGGKLVNLERVFLMILVEPLRARAWNLGEWIT